MALSLDRSIRLIAGVLVLAGLATFAFTLLPPYAQNWRLQRYLDELIQRPEIHKYPPEMVKVQVLQKAAQLGLPVRSEQVEVRQASDRISIAVRYAVAIDLPLYSVDLHLRSEAGAR